MQGKQFDLISLDPDCVSAITGQMIITKLVLTFSLILLCFLASIFTGYLGGISVFNMSIAVDYRLPFFGMTLILLVWLITACFQSFIKSLFAVVIGFFTVMAISKLLANFSLLNIPPDYNLLLIFYILFGLTICSGTFLINRFAIACFDILFVRSQFVKIAMVFITIVAARAGASLVTSQLKNVRTDDILIKAISYLSQAQLDGITANAVIVGSLYSPLLVFCAWWVNHRRNVPWNYPNLLRDWVLVIGSWYGTSFHKLDLTGVNFRGAKLANTDLRARKLYRTCFQGVTGLARARVDNRYLDLEIPKVQRLLTHACSEDPDFSSLNLRGAYLQSADLRHMKFIDTTLTGADLTNADLRGSILVRAEVTKVDFSGANLTGICIEDWNVNSKTLFTNVQCDYVYRKLDEKGEPTDRFPYDRNFESREFESLYQEVGNVVELVFKEGVNWRAFAFTLQKLELEDEGLGLELKGIEKRGDLWVIKVTHNENIPTQEVEKRLKDSYDNLQQQLASKEDQIKQLLGIASNQSEVLKELTKKPFGNSFFITGSTITNLAGNGEIKYSEAADQVRNIVANTEDLTQFRTIGQNLLSQLQKQNVATRADTQAEIIQQVILAEAEQDPVFRQFLLQQGQQFTDTIPEGAIATAIQSAITQLESKTE